MNIEYHKELNGETTTTATNLQTTSVFGLKEHHYNASFAPALFHPLFFNLIYIFAFFQ